MQIQQHTTLTDVIIQWIDPRYLQILSPGYFHESIRYLPALVVGKLPRPTPIKDLKQKRRLFAPMEVFIMKPHEHRKHHAKSN
jgi:hypothetical protein